jgi:hypothetical protein
VGVAGGQLAAENGAGSGHGRFLHRAPLHQQVVILIHQILGTGIKKQFLKYMSIVLCRESDGQCTDNKGQGIPEGLLFTPGEWANQSQTFGVKCV